MEPATDIDLKMEPQSIQRDKFHRQTRQVKEPSRRFTDDTERYGRGKCLGASAH